MLRCLTQYSKGSVSEIATLVSSLLDDLYDGVTFEVNGQKVCIRLCQGTLDEGNIHEHGYWLGSAADSQHRFDASLCKKLVNFLISDGTRSVIDLGCGKGDYVAAINAAGIECRGYDGNPSTPHLSNNTCSTLDLTIPTNITPAEWVISLEVGEHIPGQYESQFISNLHRCNTRGVILSWAIRGQGGHGHFNEKNNNEVRAIMESLDYTSDTRAEETLRSSSTLWWFRNSLMVFRRNKKAPD